MRTPAFRPTARRLTAALATAALAAGAVVAVPIAAQAATVEVTDVTFDWGINNESNGGAYFGGCNFLSAGVAGDTGSSRTWTQADGFYSTEEGNTTIVKPTADGTGLAQPTWATKCQTSDGTSVNSRTTNADNSYTQTRVQIANGTGTVDVDANTAEISWDGSFSVVYYGGMTYWSASDPTLVVEADGTGTVTASLSGYAADMDDPSIWNTLEPRDVVIAELTGVEVTASGFTVTPDYLGVSIPDDVAGRNPQADLTETNASWWGAFPADFTRFQQLTGQSSYWYTTAGGANSIQPRKATLPLAVSYTAPEAVAITTQPTAQSVSLGEQATFSVAASGATGYQWQSAATGSDTWADVSGATSAEYTVTGTTANAQQYRVVVSGAGGPVTSEAVSLTVDVPTPTVTVSKTSGLDPAGEVVTVTGTGFLPNPPSTSGTRPPLAGKFTGAYIALAKSVDGTLTNHTNSLSAYTTWGVHEEDLPSIGGTGTIINADGTFTAEIRAENFEIAEGGVWGIRTYAAGGASYAAFSTFTPVTFAVPVPDAPEAPTATLGADGTSVDVSWTAPADNGEAISGYEVTLTPSTGEAQTVAVAADQLSHTFTGLARGVDYTATVVASNAGGSSAASAASAAVTVPAVAPDAPATPSATAASDSSINVSWAAPAYDGGSAVTGYTVTVWQGSTEVTSVDVAGTTTTVTGLERATLYSVTVAATNAVGTSDPSTPFPVTTLATAPDTIPAPTVTAVSGTEIAVSWIAPADGGDPITGYVVTVRSGDTVAATANVAGDVTATTVGGLANGTSYTATVAAVNAAGTGEASPASEAVSTFSAPATPVVTASLSGTDGVSASWTVASDGGSAVTSYTATLVSGSTTQSVVTSGTSAEFGRLTPGAAYTVSVTATNAVGTSAAGVSSQVTVPAVAPAAPAAPAVALGTDGTSATITWAAPASDGGSAITGYLVSVSSGDSGDEIALGADARTHTITGLGEGDYTVAVTAVNAVGSATSASVGFALAGAAPTGEPTLLTDAELTEDSFGPGTITVEGTTATIELGADYANQWVGVAVNSDPVFLGWFLTDASGAVTVTLPSGLAAGTHHVVVYGADGAVIAYQAFTVSSTGTGTDTTTGSTSNAATGGLPATGSDAATLWPVLGFGVLLLGLGAVLTVRRRLARSGD